jgi:hypothetical protein
VTGGVAQVVECLPNKHETLNSNPKSPSHTEKENKKTSYRLGKNICKHTYNKEFISKVNKEHLNSTIKKQ